MSREAGDHPSEPPAQRRRLAEGDFGKPDVILTSEEGTEYPAHSKYLQAACEVFDDLFQLASNDATDGLLPSIPLHESAAIIELVLPLVYRKSAAGLRSQPYETLVSCLTLAHRLGMPLVVDHISIYLEQHIEEHAAEVYQLACKLDLTELEERSKKAFRSVADLSKPFALADLIGTQRAQSIYEESLSEHNQKTANLLKEYTLLTRDCAGSTECTDADCPGHMLQDLEKIERLVLVFVLKRYNDLLDRLSLESGPQRRMLSRYRRYLRSEEEKHTQSGTHQSTCIALKCIREVLSDDQ